MARLAQISDGSGRELFPVQKEWLSWFEQQTSRIVASQLPPGTGKSLLVRTLQRAYGATVVTPSNLLVNQYAGTYPDVNVLKGQAHYECSTHSMSCGEVRALGNKPCEGCPYRTSRRAALEGAPTFYNPISLYNLAKDSDFERPPVTVVDEAHQLLSTLLLVAGESFPATEYRLPTSTHASDVVSWLREQQGKVTRVEGFRDTQRDGQRAVRVLRARLKLERTIECLEADPANYVIAFANELQRDRTKVRTLKVLPLLPPRHLIDQVLGTGRIVLLSATLSRFDSNLLAQGAQFAYLDAPSPIPYRQRQILYRPGHFPDEMSLLDHIEALHREFGGPTLVHVTYALSERLRGLPGHHLRNTAENKEAIVRKFKEEGGVFWASGCAEGLDLPDGQCRLNIIPVLPRPNIGDPAVMKWMAQPGGSKRYDLETLKIFQQQVGRSTRHVNDWSITVCCDPRLPQLIDRNRSDISNSFHESIRWTGRRTP